jgi:PAS domain S-box-containing protein
MSYHQNSLNKELKQNETKYRTLFTSSPAAIFTIENEKILDVNPACVKIFGYKDKEELIGKTPWDISPKYQPDGKESYVKVQSVIKKALKGYEVNFEWKHVRKDGTMIDCDISLKMLESEGKIYLQAIVLDITEKKKAEEEIRKLSEVVKQSPISIMITDPNGVLEFVNPAFSQITGYSKEEVLGKNASIIKSGNTPISVYKDMWDTILAGKIWIGEIQNKRKNGTFFWENSTISPTIDENGTITHFVAAHKDITERKQAEKILKESENKFSKLFHTSPNVITISNIEDGKIIDINDVGLKELGYKKDEIVGKTSIELELVNQEGRDSLIKLLKEKGSYRNIELEVKTKLGEERQGLFNGQIITIGGKDFLFQTIVDISETKQTELALKAEKDFTDTALDAQLDTFFLFEIATGKAIRWNKAFKEISGYTSEEIAKLPAPASYYGKEDLNRAQAFIENVTKDGTGTIELDLICKDGSKVPTEYRVSVIKDDQGQPKYLISVGRDITDRKSLELALRESEESYRSFFETARDGAFFTSIDGRWIDCNQGFIELFKYKNKNELMGKKVEDLYADPKDRPKLLKRIMDEGYVAHMPFTGKRKDGTILHALMTATTKMDRQGNLIGYQGSITDITKRKQMEMALKKSEEKYRLLIENIPNVSWSSDHKGNTIFISPNVKQVYGFDSSTIISSGPKLWFDRVHKDDISKLQSSYNALFQDNKKFDIEYRIKHKNGNWIWLHDRAIMHFDKKDKKFAYGVFSDITERKQLEYDLKKLTTELTLAEERERRQIAVNLHDNMGQSLALAKIKTQELINANEYNKILLMDVMNHVNNAIKSSRNLTYELSPPVLYELGFVAAIRWKLTQIKNQSNLKTRLIDQSKSVVLKNEIKVLMFRTLNEILTNVIKHANATRISIMVKVVRNNLILTVRDDGKGFNVDRILKASIKSKKFGLFSIHERIEYINGNMKIESAIGKGTKISVIVPI